jgi:hypothetical protein
MYKYIILLFLSIYVLYASNPLPYAILGNKIYDNVNNIEKLQYIGDYNLFKNDIERYVHEVNSTKQEGFSLNEKSSLQERRDYLTKLRELSKDNDYYLRAAENSFNKAIKEKDSKLFNQIVNSGLINSEAHKKDIIKYYFAHSEDLNATGVVQKFLEEDENLKNKQDALQKKILTKKMRQEAKIKRIRKRDKLQQQQLEKKLDDAVEKKKIEIRKEQKRELIKSI